MPPSELRDLIASQIDNVLVDAHFPGLPGYTRGKVRDSYALPDGRRIIIATDRQSAFDKVLAAVPFKGQVLTETARFWFDATRDIVANHAIDHPDPNVLVARTLRMLPVEVVVRDYLTGSTSTSIWPMYRDGARTMYGTRLPDGLVKNQKLPETMLTPTTKAAAGEHDAPITPSEIVSSGLLPQQQWDEVATLALALFARGREVAARNGLILVDTKYEFGLDNDGTVTLADEIHTPDSSRYWKLGSYESRLAAGEEPESLDKEFLRLWISARCDPYREPIPEIPRETLIDFSARYIALYETVTGEAFSPPDTAVPVRERILGSLAPYL
ncbi:MAG: phosphoribosylaminoimidazolesuccinocarboxamide synthase [Rhodospirillales bacterium]|nr:MAG: phosphoribosylaminoimidazolesuccinocarboxamide synthase [Rhodospirillales bacterium]